MTGHRFPHRVAASVLFACTTPAVQASEALKVCLLTHNAPYSDQAAGAGFDLATAAAVATRLGRRLETIWINNPEKVTEIEDSDFPTRKLAKGACDVLFSIPGPARDSLRDATGLSLGEAYYGAAFGLYGRPGETRNRLRQLRDVAVATQAATVGAFALRLVGAKARTSFSPLETLQKVADGSAEVALVWGPAAGAALHREPLPGIAAVAGYEPPAALSWNEHPATRSTDTALRTSIDAALGGMAKDGELERLALANGVPWHAPFAKTYSLGEMNNLR